MTEHAGETKLASVRRRDLLTEAEAETEAAAGVLATRFVDAVKRLEDTLDITFGNADALIAHADLDHVADVLDLYGDWSRGGRRVRREPMSEDGDRPEVDDSVRNDAAADDDASDAGEKVPMALPVSRLDWDGTSMQGDAVVALIPID